MDSVMVFRCGLLDLISRLDLFLTKDSSSFVIFQNCSLMVNRLVNNFMSDFVGIRLPLVHGVNLGPFRSSDKWNLDKLYCERLIIFGLFVFVCWFVGWYPSFLTYL